MNKNMLGRSFVLLWFSETAFDIGAALIGFALGVWVFEQSNSVQQYAYTMLASAVPALVCAPIAGAFADRVDRRLIIALCDCAEAILVLVLAYLLAHKLLVVAHLYVFGALSGILGALRAPSYRAAVAAIVPKDQLTRANGLMGVTQGMLQIGAPLAAGYLMAAWGLEGVVITEVVLVMAGGASVFAALTSASHAIRGTTSLQPLTLFASINASFSNVRAYFESHTLMRGLAVYVLIQEGLLILAANMMTPLILANHSSGTLGLVLSLGAFGGVVGSLILVAKNMSKHLMLWVLSCDIGLAGFIALAGFATTPEIWCLCAFGAFALGSVSHGCAGALWMRKVPRERQGGLFAAMGAASLLVLIVVMLTSGALVEHVLEPMMMSGSGLAKTLGDWIGVGKGRGVALLFVLTGAGFAIASLIAMFHPTLKRLDELVQDRVSLDAHPVNVS